MKLVIAEKPMLARDIARAICGRSEQIISTGGRDPACFYCKFKKGVDKVRTLWYDKIIK